MYRFFRKLVRIFSRPVETVWEEPFDGKPAVFCPNHSGAWGPIAMMAHFELRDQCVPWFNADVASFRKMPAYVRQDYWWNPESKLDPLYKCTIPYLGAAVLPPVMKTVPGIKVHHDAHIISTFRESIKALDEGYHLVIFPQQPSGYHTRECTLNKGFLQVAPMAAKRLGIGVNFYPVIVDGPNHKITVGKKIPFDPSLTLEDQEERIVSCLTEALKEQY